MDFGPVLDDFEHQRHMDFLTSFLLVQFSDFLCQFLDVSLAQRSVAHVNVLYDFNVIDSIHVSYVLCYYRQSLVFQIL